MFDNDFQAKAAKESNEGAPTVIQLVDSEFVSQLNWFN